MRHSWDLRRVRRAHVDAVSRRAPAGTLEAVALSAKDGSLDCLVQVRVRLRP